MSAPLTPTTPPPPPRPPLNPRDLEFNRVLVMSTVHLKRNTCDAIGERGFPVMGARYEYGGFVWVNEDGEEPDDLEGFEDLIAPLTLARTLGCQWVRFDCDAFEIDTLPKYEWK